MEERTVVVKTMQTCPKCQSDHVIPDVRMIDHEDGYEVDLNVEVYENPEARIDTDRHGHYGTTRANICGACGYAELFVRGHESLWETYEGIRSRAVPTRRGI